MIAAHVLIGSHRYVVDLAKVARQPVNTLKSAVDQSAEKGEQSLDNAGIWKATSDDFVLGQGQQWFDQADESDKRRMWLTYGLDPLTSRRALKTTPSWSSVVSSYTSGSGKMRLIRTNSNYWWASTSQIHRSASLTSWSATAVTGGASIATFEDMTTFGGKCYVAYGTNGVYSAAVGGNLTLFGAVNCTAISAELGRLIGGYGTLLFELSSTGAKIDIFTHASALWTWTNFAAGSSGIYCAGDDGLKSEIYLSTLLDVTGALAPPFPVAQLPIGEIVRKMAYFGGYLVICTSLGVRVAQASQAGYLQYGPLIALGDTRGVMFEGRTAYVTCSSLPGISATDQPGIVALDLSRFTAPLTPAYSVVHYLGVTARTVRDVAAYNGKIFGLVNSGTTAIVYGTDTTYATSSYYSGLITWGVTDPKNLVSLEARWDALPSGASVTLNVVDEDGTVLQSETFNSPGSKTGTMTVSTVSPISAEAVMVRIDLNGGGGANPVILRRWTLRGVVSPTYQPHEVLLPLMLSREVEDDHGNLLLFDPYDEWAYLNGLTRSRSRVAFEFGGEATEAYVDQVGVNNGFVRWDDNADRWPDGEVLVRLITTGA